MTAAIKKRDDVIPVYVDLIKANPDQDEVLKLNNFIINKWSKSALIYIKDKAWKAINDKHKKMKDIKTIVVLLEFEDGSVRQVLTTKVQKELALKFLVGEEGSLMVSKEIEPLNFKEKVN